MHFLIGNPRGRIRDKGLSFLFRFIFLLLHPFRVLTVLLSNTQRPDAQSSLSEFSGNASSATNTGTQPFDLKILNKKSEVPNM